MPAKAKPDEQRKFYEETLKPLIDKAHKECDKHILLFLDASHFVMGCDFLGSIYGKVRRYVTTFSGRQRYNVLGAINILTKNVTVVTNDTYITATEICTMLKKVASEYAGKVIHIALDNARYQKCDTVRDLANELGIELVYIPPYSPNLNLIERLWKLVKGKLRSKYYSDFSLFKSTIDSIIAGTETTYKDQVAKLIGEKVQLYDDLVPLCENTFIKESTQKQAVA